jgi:catechol 2,3-dioxygenase-like lactoylglutathione lyase family enzyme
MDLNHLHIAVKDLTESRRFYETYLGFKERTYHGHILFLSNDQGFDMALDPKYTPEPLPKWFHFGMRMKTAEDVKNLYKNLQQEPKFIKHPLEEYPDFVFFYAVDADGYPIEVYWE